MVEKAAFLYSENGLIASTNPVWLHWEFDVLIGIFERVGIRTNVAKTVEMVCQPGPISGQHSSAAYEWRMTGEGDPHHARDSCRVVCG